MKTLSRTIEIFRGLNKLAAEEPEVIEFEVTPADYFDFRYLSKKEITKLSVEALESLVRYGDGYLDTYASGQFLYKRDRHGDRIADFEEAGVAGQISRVLQMLKMELSKRG